MSEFEEELIDIAVSVARIQQMFDKIEEWFIEDDRGFHGARIVGLCNVRYTDGEEDPDAACILLVGTRKQYEDIKASVINGTVLDFWPVDMEKIFQQARNNEIPFLTWPNGNRINGKEVTTCFTDTETPRGRRRSTSDDM